MLVSESAQLGEVIYSNGSDIFMHDVKNPEKPIRI